MRYTAALLSAADIRRFPDSGMATEEISVKIDASAENLTKLLAAQ